MSLAALSGTTLVETYLDIFCTKKRDKSKDRIATSAIEKTDPSSLPTPDRGTRPRLATGLAQARASRRASAAPRCSPLRQAVIARFQAEKDRRGLLDYDDLIDKTLDAAEATFAPPGCTTSSTAAFDHVLIDEAQDTSPKQWEIVKALVERVFRRPWRARTQAHDFCRRRREAIDLFVPGRGAARIRRQPQAFRDSRTSAPNLNSSSPNSNIRCAPATTCWAGSTRCSRARKRSPD